MYRVQADFSASNGSSKSSCRATPGLRLVDGLTEEGCENLPSVHRNVPIDEHRVDKVVDIGHVLSLQQALQLARDHLLEFEAAHLSNAGRAVGVRVNDLARLGRKVNPVELRDVNAEANRYVIRVAVEILEIHAGIEYTAFVIKLPLDPDLGPFEVEDDSGLILDELACKVELSNYEFFIDCRLRREVQVG